MRYIIAAILMITPVYAQQGFDMPIVLKCNTTKFILNMLDKTYKEVYTGGGTSKGERVRLYESHKAGNEQTWSLVLSSPKGLSCLMKGGEDWITEPKITKGDPS